MSYYTTTDSGSLVIEIELLGLDLEIDYDVVEEWREDYEGDGNVPNGLNRLDTCIRTMIDVTAIRILDHHSGRHVEISVSALSGRMLKRIIKYIEEQRA